MYILKRHRLTIFYVSKAKWSNQFQYILCTSSTIYFFVREMPAHLIILVSVVEVQQQVQGQQQFPPMTGLMENYNFNQGNIFRRPKISNGLQSLTFLSMI